ncbi:carbohydrate ABC transporter permease [Cryptosporangium sp. NPDC048952]|uniref:carbohydrate ABC transporter permease n=1 Tax=Cryptosporangium sp. NPDC048952 TaxID=3363961 RepID=UPI00371F8262
MTSPTSIAPAPPALPNRSTAPRYRVGVRSGTIASFLLPFFVPFLLFYVAPVVYALVESFQKIERSGGQFGTVSTVFGGVTQYAAVLSDSEFWASLGRVGLFGVVQVPVMLFLSLLIALLLDSRLVSFPSFFRLTAFLPYAVPGLIAAIMWSFLYHPQLSPVVQILSDIGISVDFLDQSSVLWSIANISTWLWTGYNMLIIYSALQAIPQELYEAARLDGAGNLAIALRIKLPIVFPSIVLTTIFSIIGTLQLYAEPSVLAQVAPSVSTTYTPNMMTYGIASGGNYQQAAAMSVVIAIATFILSFGFMKITSRRSDA